MVCSKQKFFVPQKPHPNCKAKFGFYESCLSKPCRFHPCNKNAKKGFQKRYENFKKESITMTLNNVPKIIQRKENGKIQGLYEAVNYWLSSEYQKIPCGKPCVAFLE